MNNNPIYLWRDMLRVQDASKSLFFMRTSLLAKVKRQAIPNHPTLCLKALALKQWLNISHPLGVIVLRGIVLIRQRKRKVWTRYTDGAIIQRAIDGGGRIPDNADIFALWRPRGTRSHSGRTKARSTGRQPNKERRRVRQNRSRWFTLRQLLDEQT